MNHPTMTLYIYHSPAVDQSVGNICVTSVAKMRCCYLFYYI